QEHEPNRRRTRHVHRRHRREEQQRLHLRLRERRVVPQDRPRTRNNERKGAHVPGATGCATDPSAFPPLRSTSRRMSFIGSTERTRGTTSKLFSGGGDWVNHSSVFACHGSLPARRPERRLITTFTNVTRMPAARMNEPIVEMTFSVVQLPWSG